MHPLLSLILIIINQLGCYWQWNICTYEGDVIREKLLNASYADEGSNDDVSYCSSILNLRFTPPS